MVDSARADNRKPRSHQSGSRPKKQQRQSRIQKTRTITKDPEIPKSIGRRGRPGKAILGTGKSYLWPVTPGCVVQLLEPVWLRNIKTGRSDNHTVYIWIMSWHKKKTDNRPDQRVIRVNYTYVPINPEAGSYFNIGRLVQMESITRNYRRHGVKKLSSNCLYRGNNDSMKAYYKIIGLLKVG